MKNNNNKKFFVYGDNDTTDDAENILREIKKDMNVNQFLFAGDGPYAGGIRIKDENGNIVYDDSK